MKLKKHVCIALMLTMVFLFASVSPIAVADTQLAYSKISEDLLAAYSQRGSGKIDVIVWLTDNATEKYQQAVSKTSTSRTNNAELTDDILTKLSLSREKYTLEERLKKIEEQQSVIKENRRIAREIYLEHNTAIAKQFSNPDVVTYVSQYSPLLICSLSKNEALNIARSDDIYYMTRGDIEGEDCMSLAYTNTDTNILHSEGYYGQGIKIGILESGCPDVTNSALSGVANRITVKYDNSIAKAHATAVASIMVNASCGFAKGFERLYSSTCSTYSEMVAEIEWLLSQEVNVINMSWGFPPVPPNSYGLYSKWIDHIAYNHSAHIIIASGNYGENKVVTNAMAYNAVTVGAVDDNGTDDYSDDAYWISGVSASPGSSYNTLGNLAYKPDICSYGANISVSSVGTDSGTSFAAPQVAGIVASLCSLEPELLTLMDLTKAILTCSTLKASSYMDFELDCNTTDANYRQIGAGIANANNAMELLNNGTYVSGHISSTENRDAFSIGTLQKGETVTVSLSFLKRTRFADSDHGENATLTDTPLPDLDVYIVPRVQINVMSFDKNNYTNPSDYTYIFRSISVDNNTEKITFSAAGTTEYIIVVNKAASSDYHDILYGVAWLKHTSDIH